MCRYRLTLHSSHRKSQDMVRTCTISARDDTAAADSALHMANMFAAVCYELSHVRCGNGEA